MKNVYFLSDAHLGSRAIEHNRAELVPEVEHVAQQIYGGCFVFDTVEKVHQPSFLCTSVLDGYTRFLGKLSELTDMGVEVHFFTGNHDIWCGDYLTRECGVVIHREPLTTEIYGKEFYLAHGDGLGDPDKKFKLLRTMFHSRTLQTLFSTLHPRWSVEFGLRWAKHSRLKRIDGKEPDYMGENNEHQIQFDVPMTVDEEVYIRMVLQILFGIQYKMLVVFARVLILGDWINYFSYAVFDGENLFLEEFIEGETKL